MTEQQLRVIVAQTAMAEVGYVGEMGMNVKSPVKFNKYAEYLDSLGDFYNGKKNGYDWCAIFVDYIMVTCMGRAIMEIATSHWDYGAGVDESMARYAKVDALTKLPEVGDEVFYFKRSTGKYTHTGIVVGVDNEKFITVEGNCSNSVKLYAKRWDADDGYYYFFGQPNYELAAEMLSANHEPTEREMNEHEKWAIENGLMIGDGNGNYFLDDPIKRGDLCSVLFRLAALLDDN